VATTGTATVGAGLADIALTVPVKGDSTAEANESFTVTISAPVDGAVGTAAGKGVILNDDPPARGRRVSVGNASVAEGRQDNRSLTLTVTLSALSRSSVTVHFDLVDGTASGSDYQGGSGTLRFAPGQRTSLLSFSVRGDTDLEPSETVRVILSRPQGAVLGRRQGTATILNDD
jgi:hypothetical protein